MENYLYKSNVIYDETKHTYTLEGKPLKGITGMLSRHLFPNKYEGIPDHIMEAARERGKRIHAEIEMYLNGFPPSQPSPEFIALTLLDLYFKESEFIVTDGENFATPIDLIGDDMMIYDIKTTYKVDEDYCSWQLSICDYLLKIQTGQSATGLAVIWLREGKAEVVPVKRIPDEEIKRLLDAEISGEQFIPKVPDIGIKNDTLAAILKAENEIKAIKANLNEVTAKANELKEGLLRLMIANGVTKYSGEGVTLTVKKAYERESLDSKRIKEELPELYARYSKKTTVKETLTIKTT